MFFLFPETHFISTMNLPKSELLSFWSLMANKEVLMVKDWIANAYEGMSGGSFSHG